jgi:hypothetical protein
MTKRLVSAMAAYAVLVAIAFRILQGKILYFVLIVFGALVVLTLSAAARADR